MCRYIHTHNIDKRISTLSPFAQDLKKKKTGKMKLCCLELYIQGIKLQKRKEVIFTKMRVVTGLVTSGGGRGCHWERVGLRVLLDLQDGYYCVFFKI